MENHNRILERYYDSIASQRDTWKKKNAYYYHCLTKFLTFLIPQKKKVLEVGCGTGDLLGATNPSTGVGIDLSSKMIKIAREKYPRFSFQRMSAERISLSDSFDYIILSDLIGNLFDVQVVLEKLHAVATNDTRIIISYYNYLWETVLTFGEKIGIKMPQPLQNWLSAKDAENLLEISDWEVIKKGTILLFPINIPYVSSFLNTIIAKLPFIQNVCLVYYIVARPKIVRPLKKDYSVSVIIPARNEEGNIEPAVRRVPNLGTFTEIIFVEGNSKDNTKKEIKRVIKKYKKKKRLTLINQGKGIGKGDAVRKGFKKARGDILLILDADLTVAPEDLRKFYHILKTRKAEYVQGSRLVYPMEKQAMKLLNTLGNKFFSFAFTYLLNHPIKDTLCGTKGLFAYNYKNIARNRSYFGDFDPFGDFDLIFGASKLNLKMVEIPIRYHARTYGKTNISRFKHGWLLFKMMIFAARKIKFI